MSFFNGIINKIRLGLHIFLDSFLLPQKIAVIAFSTVACLSFMTVLFINWPTAKSQLSNPNYPANSPMVLGESAKVLTGRIDFNIPSFFNDNITFNGNVYVKDQLIDLLAMSTSIASVTNSSTGAINKILVGTGLSINSEKDPTITNTGVISLNGSAGTLTLTGSDGVSISGMTVTNNDKGTSQMIFKTIAVLGQTSFAAGSNTDTLTFATSGTGILLTTDATNKKVIISANTSDLNVSGWNKEGTTIRLTDLTNNVGIGTATASAKLDVLGTTNFQGGTTIGDGLGVTGDTDLDGSVTITGGFSVGSTTYLSGTTTIETGGLVINGGIDNNSGGITEAGAITGATGFTSTGTIKFADFSTGIIHSDFTGELSSAAIDLNSGDVTNILPIANGGTGLSAVTLGDMLYASSNNVLSTLGIGGPGEVLSVSAGVPTWAAVFGGPGGICNNCLINNPGSDQTITPSANVTGLIVAQAHDGNTDIFKVTNNAGDIVFLKVDASGNVSLGSNANLSVGTFTVSPANTDPISISPVTAGTTVYTGTITSNVLTANRSWSFPNATGDVCLDTGNCAGIGANIGGSGVSGYLTRWQSQYALEQSSIFDNGNVGIGTTTPGAYKLNLVGTSNFNGAVNLMSNLAIAGGSTLSGTLNVIGATDLNSTLGVTGAANLSSTLGVTGATTIGGNLMVNGNGTSWIMGSLGIGTSTPAGTNKLEVDGNIAATSFNGNTITTGTGTLTLANSLITSGAFAITLTATNTTNVTLPTTGTLATLAGQETFSNKTFSGNTFFPGSGVWDTSGNIGIGTTAPSSSLHVYSTSTSTSYSGVNIDWQPGTATTSTGDLFSLNVGVNGTIANIFNVKDNGSSVFSVSQTSITLGLPTSINTEGDTVLNNDLIFTNPESGYIKSGASLYIEAGKVFNSADLVLRAFNKGNIIVDAEAFVTNYAATVSGQFVVGTSTPDSANIGNFYLTNSATLGKALAIFNQTESQDIFTASSSGTTRFVIQNGGNVGIGTTNPGALLEVMGSTNSFKVASDMPQTISITKDATYTTYPEILSSGSLMIRSGGGARLGLQSADSTRGVQLIGTNVLSTYGGNLSLSPNEAFNTVFTAGGNVGIGTTGPTALLHISGNTATSLKITNAQASGVGIDLTGLSEGYSFSIANNQFIRMANTGGTQQLLLGISSNNETSLRSPSVLHLQTNAGSSEMTILSNGNVGIGTTGPTNKLQVIGSVRSSSSLTYPQYEFTQLDTQAYAAGSSPSHSRVLFEGIETSVGGVMYGSMTYWAGTNEHNSALLFSASTQLTQNGLNIPTGAQMVLTNAGNVGIGTTGPGARLEINQPNLTFGSTNPYEKYTYGASEMGRIYMDSNWGYVIDTTQSGSATSNIVLTPKSNVIVTQGNVGIGTTAPGAKLDVAGSVNITGYATASASLAIGYNNAPAGIGNAIFSGNVGIGTTNPTDKLTIVNSNTSTSPTGLTATNTSSAGTSGFTFNNNNSSGIFLGGVYGSSFTDSSLQGQAFLGSKNGLIFLTDASVANSGTNSIKFMTGGYTGSTQTRMIINSNGNIGIGTTSPTALIEGVKNDLTTGNILSLTSTSPTYTNGKLLNIDLSNTYVTTQTVNGNLASISRNITASVNDGTGTILYDASSSTSITAASSMTWAHTTANVDNRVLIVGVSIPGNVTIKTVTGVTYNGVTLTQIGGFTGANAQTRTELWKLVNPDAGTHDIVVNLSGSTAAVGGASTYTGVDQSTPNDEFTAAQFAGSSASLSVASSVNDLVIDVMILKTSSSPTVGAGQTERWNTVSGTNPYGAGSSEPGASTVTMSWSRPTGALYWGIGAVSLNPAPNSGPTILGDVARFTSNCTTTIGFCSDGSNILELDQQFTNATGSALNIKNAGSGNIATFDSTNVLANGLSIDLESVSSSQYLLNLTGGNGTINALRINADGNVGIGTTTPAAKLDIAGSINITGYATASASLAIGYNNALAGIGNAIFSGNVGIGTTNPLYKLQVGEAGDGTEAQANAWNSLSDSRLKQNIKPIENSLDKILTLQGITFDWRSNGKSSIGLIAQDVSKVFPEAVSTDENGILSLNYGGLTAPIIEAIKEQSMRIDTLAAKIATGSATPRNDTILSPTPTPFENSNISNLDLIENLKLKIENSLKTLTVTIKTIFENVTEFASTVLFHDRVTFEDKDMGGFAIIKKSDRKVEIKFAKEYSQTPIVTISNVWILDSDVAGAADKIDGLFLPSEKYVILNPSTTGFTIILDEKAITDLKFSWTALAVKDATTTSSDGTTATPSATLTPTLEATQSAALATPSGTISN